MTQSVTEAPLEIQRIVVSEPAGGWDTPGGATTVWEIAGSGSSSATYPIGQTTEGFETVVALTRDLRKSIAVKIEYLVVRDSAEVDGDGRVYEVGGQPVEAGDRVYEVGSFPRLALEVPEDGSVYAPHEGRAVSEDAFYSMNHCVYD